MATNLQEFYTSKGQTLPSVTQRQGVAKEAGIQNYTGTAQQNTQLLGYLQKQPTPVATPTMPSTTNVNAAVISPTTQPVAIPPSTVSNPAPIVNVVPQVQQSLADKAVAQTKVEDTDIQKLVREIAMQDAVAAGNLTGQTQALADAEKAAGVEAKKQELQTLNSQILQKQAEINQSDVQLIANQRAEERRDTLLPFAQSAQAKLAGDAAILRALKTSEIGVLNARALATQGDIELAKDTAKTAVDLKYAPYRELIAVHKAQLEALQPILSSDEKKQANEQTIRGQVALKEIEKLSKFQSDALTNAIVNNAPQSVLNKINNAQSIADITAVGGQYIVSQSDRLDLALKRAQIAKITSEAGTATQKAPTQSQVEYAGYADRIAQANAIIDSKADTFANMNYKDYKLVESRSPLANTLLTPDQRQVAQAMRNFITAKLRKESGATIQPSEFEDARLQYFPVLGDDAQTLANKKQLRDSVLQNNIIGAGNAYTKSNSIQAIDNTTFLGVAAQPITNSQFFK